MPGQPGRKGVRCSGWRADEHDEVGICQRRLRPDRNQVRHDGYYAGARGASGAVEAWRLRGFSRRAADRRQDRLVPHRLPPVVRALA